MKINKGYLFPTTIYHLDSVLEKNDIEDIRKHIFYMYNNSSVDNWQSESLLHKNDEFKILVNKITKTAKYIFDDMKYVYEQFEITDMWANVSKQGEYHGVHTHSNNILSGVFYIQSDQTGNIKFLDPRPAAGVLCPDMKEFNDKNSHICGYPSNVNTMVLFPSWLQHFVTDNESCKERISLSFNLMFKGFIGGDSSLQSARF